MIAGATNERAFSEIPSKNAIDFFTSCLGGVLWMLFIDGNDDCAWHEAVCLRAGATFCGTSLLHRKALNWSRLEADGRAA